MRAGVRRDMGEPHVRKWPKWWGAAKDMQVANGRTKEQCDYVETVQDFEWDVANGMLKARTDHACQPLVGIDTMDVRLIAMDGGVTGKCGRCQKWAWITAPKDVLLRMAFELGVV